MARITTSVGGGIGDSTGTYVTMSTTTDVVSDWTPSAASAFAHGGFDVTGVTMNTTVKPVNVVTMGFPTGGTSGGGNSTASYYIELATANTGAGGYNNSGTVTGYTGTLSTNSTASAKYTNNWNTLAEYDTGALAWNVLAGTTYYYGFYGRSAGNFVFGRGGTTGSIWINGTPSSTWANSRISGHIIWDTVPTAPTITAASINTDGRLSMTWTVGTDDGMTSTAAWDDTSGDHIRGYNIVYKATTASAWQVFSSNISYSTPSVSGTSRSVSALTPENGYFKPGVTYEFRVAALNGTTDAVQTDYSVITAQTGVRSASFNAQAPGGVYNGSAWVPFTALKAYNGSTFVAPTTAKVYTGSVWKDLI